MPTTRVRTRRPVQRVELSEAVTRYLLTGKTTPGDWDVFILSGSKDKLRAAWAKARRDLLPACIREAPGRRPFAWWVCDAPRWTERFNAYFDGTIMEPRQRIGGSGVAERDRYPAIIPRFFRGIPYFIEVDPADPPTFESEAAYLHRHGLLTPTETKWLTAHPEAMEPEAVRLEH
jgi:hypothetical protein